MVNILLFSLISSTDSECCIHESTLLSYARQIAIGMASTNLSLFTFTIK